MSKFNQLFESIKNHYINSNTKEKYQNIVNQNGNAYSSSKFLYKSICIESTDNKLTKFYTNLNGDILTEKVFNDYTPDDNHKGGIIVFSTIVNAIKQDDNIFLDFFKKKIKSIINYFTAEHRIDIIANKHNLVGWTIGRFLHGRYTSSTGKSFSENSLSVEIIGVTFNELVTIADEICREFDQETVLVKDYSSLRIVFVDGK